MRQWHITCFTRGDRKAEAHKVCARGLQAIGFGIKTQGACFARARDPMVQPGNLRDAFITGGINCRHRRRGGGRPCYWRAFRAIARVHGLRVARNRLIGSSGIGDMPYREWRQKFDLDVQRRDANEKAEAKTFDDVLKAGEDFQAGRISEAERDAIYAAHYDASTRLENDTTYRYSKSASGFSMLGNRSVQGDSLENQIADHYQRIEDVKGKLERGEGNPNRLRPELEMLSEDLNDLLRQQDKQAGLSTFEAKPAEAPAETSNLPRWEQPMPAHIRPGTPAYNREIMERHQKSLEREKQNSMNRPLWEIFSDVLDEEDGTEQCAVCAL